MLKVVHLLLLVVLMLLGGVAHAAALDETPLKEDVAQVEYLNQWRLI